MANTPVIRVNGFELPLWASIEVTRTIDAPADTFSVSYNLHEQTPGGDVNPLTFDGDEPVVLTLDGETLLTGYIDHAEIDFSTEGGQVQFSGYSRTADLVACPILPKPERYKDKTIESIVRSLCEPFSIDVEVDDGAVEDARVVLEVFKADFGESVHEAIARAANYRGLLAVCTPEGGLKLTRVGSRKISTVLAHATNLKRVRVVRDARDRYSDYYVVSANAGRFDPDNTGKDGKVSLARDPGVGRYRPTILHAEQDVRTQSRRLAQGEWERNRRVGDALRISTEFPQWRNLDGIWTANDLVRVEINKRGLALDRYMVIASVVLHRDASSSSAQLELVHPDSLNPRQVPLPRRSKPRAKAAADEFPDAPEVYNFDNTGFGEDDEDFVGQFGQDGDPEDYQDANLDPFE